MKIKYQVGSPAVADSVCFWSGSPSVSGSYKDMMTGDSNLRLEIKNARCIRCTVQLEGNAKQITGDISTIALLHFALFVRYACINRILVTRQIVQAWCRNATTPPTIKVRNKLRQALLNPNGVHCQVGQSG